MKVEYRDPSSLKPHPRNSRTHSDRQIADLGRAIIEFGFHQPILIDEGSTILAGHARARAALAIELGQVPVVVAKGLSEPQKRALVIADNHLHEFGAGWDRDLLGAELRDLMAQGIDISLTGFEPEEQPPEREEAEDDAPPVEAVIVSRDGDVWDMDGHRLVVGDATDPVTVSLAFESNGASGASLMVTDPPYGVEYDANWRNVVQRANGTWVAARAVGEVLNDDVADWRAAWKLFPGDVAYIWHAGVHGPAVQRSIEAAGLVVAGLVVWAKTRHVISRGAYHWKHEPCLYAVRPKGKTRWQSGHAEPDVWWISHSRSGSGHSTQKPVEAMRRPILLHTKPGDTVYDPFLGSGTTIIAAQTCGRRCVGLELNPAYADVIVKRWQSFTGKAAILAQTGDGFEPTGKARLEVA